MSAFNQTGAAFDQSGNVRTLTYNGNPTYNFEGLAPYIDFDGVGDFLSRADEAGLDITGTEAYVASAVRGLTLGGWYRIDSFAANQWLSGKYNTVGNNRSYALAFLTTPEVRFIVSGNGTATITAISSVAPVVTTWTFWVGRFTPSSELAIFQNNVKTINTTSIPASIFNSTASYVLGARDNGAADLMTGRQSMQFLCATALSDAIIGALYQNSRAMFGV
jgi:hypothetical protein